MKVSHITRLRRLERLVLAHEGKCDAIPNWVRDIARLILQCQEDAHGDCFSADDIEALAGKLHRKRSTQMGKIDELKHLLSKTYGDTR